MAYDPNRDSGIAEPRSYVEISKDVVSGLVEDTLNPTGRYFAQLVYNVGQGGGGGGSQFDEHEATQLKRLVDYVDALIGLSNLQVKCISIPLQINTATNSTYGVDDPGVILAASRGADGDYRIENDVNNIDGDTETEYLLNINRICL